MDDWEISDEHMNRIFDEYEGSKEDVEDGEIVPDTQIDMVAAVVQRREVSACVTQPKLPVHSALSSQIPSTSNSNPETPELSSKDLLALVKAYIQVDKREELLMQGGGGLTYEERWAMITRLHNNHRSRPTRRSSTELQLANRTFSDACDKYRNIIEVVDDAAIAKPTKATYDSRYLFEYGKEFVGHKAYKLRYEWLTRFGSD